MAEGDILLMQGDLSLQTTRLAMEVARSRGGRAPCLRHAEEAGCALADAAGVTQVPGLRVDAVDTTGAGGTFCGGLPASFARGAAWPEAVQAAQRASAITVTRPGVFAALLSAAELAVILAMPAAMRD